MPYGSSSPLYRPPWDAWLAGRSPTLGQQQQWSLNDGGGVRLRRRPDFPIPGRLELHASMYWQVIKDERDGYGPFRITTTGYDYSLVIGDKGELWAMHWHAQGLGEASRDRSCGRVSGQQKMDAFLPDRQKKSRQPRTGIRGAQQPVQCREEGTLGLLQVRAGWCIFG